MIRFMLTHESYGCTENKSYGIVSAFSEEYDSITE